MTNLVSLEKMRKSYLKMVMQTLKENLQKASTLNLDDLAITHYAMRVEENCLDKSRGSIASYTKAITEARLKIERFTSAEKLFPMIADSMHIDNSKVVPTAEKNNVVQKRTVPLEDDIVIESAMRPKYNVDKDVIVIDSSDSEDEQDRVLIDDDDDASEDQFNNNENIIPKGEILISVQTTSVDISKDKKSQ